MPHIFFIMGTRPEVIKMAPIILEWQSRRAHLTLCSTGQHKDLLTDILKFFAIIPDIEMDLGAKDQTPKSFLLQATPLFQKHLQEYQPDLVAVQGDTSSAFAGAMAAFDSHFPVMHIEAGLRTCTLASPFPEEMYRRQITGMSCLHFAPTVTAQKALLKEGVDPETTILTGNTGIDSLHLALQRIDSDPDLISDIKEKFSRLDRSRPIILLTVHRHENRNQRLDDILQSVEHLATRENIQILICVHLHPLINKKVHQRLAGVKNIHLYPPLHYPAFIWLLQQVTLTLTDSGGVQEEAPSLGCPLLILRDLTERQEGLQEKGVKLIGTNTATIVAEVMDFLGKKDKAALLFSCSSVYGDGFATQRIVDRLLKWKKTDVQRPFSGNYFHRHS